MKRADAQPLEQAAGPAKVQAEQIARASYGRLVAILASRTRDIELAEDALSDAFERALRTWPESGVPDRPEAWLLTVAGDHASWRRRGSGSTVEIHRRPRPFFHIIR